jgi:hypothetical protein
MSDPACVCCSGFGWVPDDRPDPSGWYEQDWRLMLDPSQGWARCPRCRADEAPGLTRLHDDLARVLMRRLDREVTIWSDDGPWKVGLVDDFRRVYRWRDLACVCRQNEPRRWIVLSGGGVSHDLDDGHCRIILREAGAPPLRVLDG